jgi:cysteine desulfurase / selenocysteine lyase
VNRIYLDNAATSWPKPEAVYQAVDRYLRENGAPAGRSAYSQATEVERQIAAARAALARLIGAGDARQIVFTQNGTDSLNLAIHGLLKPGDHAICTDADHNSVLRPLRDLEMHGKVELTRIGCDPVRGVDPDDIRRALKSNTRLVAMTHASNVTGAIQPASAVGEICRNRGVRFLVDAAQTLGHLPLSIEELQADMLAAPGHKGLLGPLGTGVLYMRAEIVGELRSIRQGGTGTSSDDDHQPATLPDKYESGNHNAPGLVGLVAALAWIENRGISVIRDHEQQLAERLRNGLCQIAGVRVFSANTVGSSAAVVSIAVEGYDPQEVAAVLDANFGIQVRAGLHCAPRMHRALGTIDRGGTVRFSIGAFNTPADIDAAIAAITDIAASG